MPGFSNLSIRAKLYWPRWGRSFRLPIKAEPYATLPWPVPLFSGGDAGQMFVGFGVAGEFFLDGVPVELAAGVVGDVAEQGGAGGAEADLYIRGGAFARAHGIDERGGVKGGSVGGEIGRASCRERV